MASGASGASNWASNVVAGVTHKVKKMPNAQISSADNLAAGNAARFRFIMTLNNFTYGFKSIGGLEVKRGLENISEGGVNDHDVYVGKFDKYDTILTLNRGMLLREWSALTTASLMAASRIGNNIARRAALMAIGATDAQYTLENGPAFGDIKVYNPRTLELSDWWTFMSLGVTKRNPPDLDAEKSGADGDEVLELQVIDLKQKPVSWMPTNVSSMVGFFKDDGSEDTYNVVTGRTDSIGSSYTGQEEGKGGALGLRDNLGSNYNNNQEASEQEEKGEDTKDAKKEEHGEEVKEAEEKLEKEKEELKAVEDEIKAEKEKLAEIERKGGGGALGLKNNLGSNYTAEESSADGEKKKQEMLKLEEEKKAMREKIKKAEEEAQKRRQAVYEAAKAAEEAKRKDKEQKNIEKAQKQKEQDAMDKFISDNT